MFSIVLFVSSRGVTADNLCRVHGYPSRRNSVMVRDDTMSTTTLAAASSVMGSSRIGAPSGGIPVSGTGDNIRYIGPGGMHSAKCTTDLHRSCFCVRFIAEHTRLKEESLRVCICFCFVFFCIRMWVIFHLFNYWSSFNGNLRLI